MSQRNVERLIGRLVTDEALRARFLASPERTVAGFVAEGWELTAIERAALAGLDGGLVVAFARGVDPRIRKAPLVTGIAPRSPHHNATEPEAETGEAGFAGDPGKEHAS